MNTQNTINAQTTTDSIDPTDLIAQLNSFGFDAGLAVATEAEIQASTACGQMSLVSNEEAEQTPINYFTRVVAQESFKNIKEIFHDLQEPVYSYTFSELLALVADMCVSSSHDMTLQQGAWDYQQTNATYQLLKLSLQDAVEGHIMSSSDFKQCLQDRKNKTANEYTVDNGSLTQEQIQTIEQNSPASSTPDDKFTQRLF